MKNLLKTLERITRELQDVDAQCQRCKGPCEYCGLVDRGEILADHRAALIREINRKNRT